MKRIATLLSVCLLAVSFAAAQASLPKIQFTQSEENAGDEYDDGEYEEGDIFFDYGMNLAGDQYIKIGLGIDIPLNFPDPVAVFKRDSQLRMGGIGMLGYHSFITQKVALGFDLGFAFNMTIGGHTFNTVPFIFTATYEPTIKRWAFPMSLGLGFAWESYNSKNYFPGLLIKPEAGVHFRVSENWSLGLETGVMLLPQLNALHGEGNNRIGYFWTTNVVARYMF
ncbi:MAG: hypothetical protein KBS64_05700 [Treponema sp.]|nr:hypothetical protein [Candidatus Treponema equi]